LTNVARHAGRDVGAELFVLASDESLIVRVQDDGVGFDVPGVVKMRDSTGISGMEERARLLGGTFVVESSPGEGTVVSAELPLASQNRVGFTS
jgi:signal transduction histidine kinase